MLDIIVYITVSVFSVFVLLHSINTFLKVPAFSNFFGKFKKKSKYSHGELILEEKSEIKNKIKESLLNQNFKKIEELNIENLAEELKSLDLKLLGVGYGKGEHKVRDAILKAYTQWGGDFIREDIILNFVVGINFNNNEINEGIPYFNLNKYTFTTKNYDLLTDEVITFWTKANITDKMESGRLEAQELMLERQSKFNVIRMPKTEQDLEDYFIPNLQGNKLLSKEDIEKIRMRNEEMNIEDFNFNSDKFKVESKKTKKHKN